MKQTDNYGFDLYDGTDNVGYNAENKNFEIIDKKLKEVENNALYKKRMIKFTESGTFTFPEDVKTIDVFLLNGGQGGAGGGYKKTSATSSQLEAATRSDGGFGGDYCYHYNVNIEDEREINVVVGAGGVGEAPRDLKNTKNTQTHSSSYGGESYLMIGERKIGCPKYETRVLSEESTTGYDYPDEFSWYKDSANQIIYNDYERRMIRFYVDGIVCLFDGKTYGGKGGKGACAWKDSDDNEIKIDTNSSGATRNAGAGGIITDGEGKAENGSNAINNTGAGGGGGASTLSTAVSNAAYGGNGGSGIVIILY